MLFWRNRRKERPSYPSASRQWQGFFFTLCIILCLEIIARNFTPIKNPGSYLLLVVMYVSYRSGLRMGFICSAVSLLYNLYAYSEPHQYFVYTPKNLDRIISGLIVYPLFAWLVGGIQGRLRNAAIREWEARDEAESEAAQRRQTEETLRSSEDLRQLVVDSAMDAIITIGEDGRIRLWNPSAEQKFGWKSEEVVGKRLSETIIPPSYRTEHEQGLQRFLETGEGRVFGRRLELTGLAKDGREFPIELSIVPHRREDGYLFIGFVRDMTEQKKLNERLRQSQKMEAIGTLAGGIAHDFNNILTSISGNLVLAREEVAADHPSQESLAEIEKGINRATQVVRQILTFSSAQEQLAETIDVAETLSEAIKLLRAATSTTMEIAAHFDPNLPPIRANGTDLHQVVLNLGINAFQAMQGQRGRFEVSATETVLDESSARSMLNITAGRYVQITARDTGVGMGPDTVRRVFEPFFTTKAKGEGTGLGLAVVYGIVERLQGAIYVYSELDKGTVFHLYFPVAEKSSATPTMPEKAMVSGHGERILYVDDDEALVYMMSRMLRRLNYDVTSLQDPLEALSVFKSDPDSFALVITDMSMPHMDGPSLVHELHTIRPDLPIVMVTGYIRPADLEQARNLGITELILKPNTVHDLGETLHRIMSGLAKT